MSEAQSRTLMPTGSVTRYETKPENAPAVSVHGDNYLLAGPIPFRYMTAPLAMDSNTSRGTLLRTFRPHPDQSPLLTPHLRHSRFWELSSYKVTLTPVANKLNTSGRISVYYVANPYTANSLTEDHEIQRAMTAERRWEMDCQTELSIPLDFSGRLMNCCVTPELFFSQLGCLRVTCLTPPQSDACPMWQVVIEGSANFYGIDTFDNRLFRTEGIYALQADTNTSDQRTIVTTTASTSGQLRMYEAAIPVTFSTLSTMKLTKNAMADIQLSRTLVLTYVPHLASAGLNDPGSLVLSTNSTRLYNMVTQVLRFTTARLKIGDVKAWLGTDHNPVADTTTFSQMKALLPLRAMYSGYIYVSFESPEAVTADIQLPSQEARIIMSGPWVI